MLKHVVVAWIPDDCGGPDTAVVFRINTTHDVENPIVALQGATAEYLQTKPGRKYLKDINYDSFNIADALAIPDNILMKHNIHGIYMESDYLETWYVAHDKALAPKVQGLVKALYAE